MSELIDCPFVVSGPSGAWKAQHPVGRPVGPASLEAGGAPLVTDMMIGLDDMSDALAVVDGIRMHHRAGEAQVRGTGHLPFGAEPRMVWASRYLDGLARFTVDLTIPRGLVLGRSLQVGSMALPGSWTHARIHRVDGDTVDVDLSDAAVTTWEQPGIPQAVVLTRGDGMQLEIGLGGDTWRWQNGLFGPENRGRICLDRQADGWQLSRHVSVVDEDTPAPPRTYRYTHYLAWHQPAPAVPAPVEGMVATWRPNGDLALRQLSDLAPGQALIIDMTTLDLHEHQQRDHAPAGPCMAASRVQKRLKRVVRQIANVERKDFPIRFRHLTSGPCSIGKHVDRNGVRAHTDVGGLMDFASWTRTQFGPERDIAIDAPPADWPLMHVLFRPEPPAI